MKPQLGVGIETTGANAENEIPKDEIQTITQPKGTQQENTEVTAEHQVQEEREIMHEPETQNVQQQPGEARDVPYI